MAEREAEQAVLAFAKRSEAKGERKRGREGVERGRGRSCEGVWRCGLVLREAEHAVLAFAFRTERSNFEASRSEERDTHQALALPSASAKNHKANCCSNGRLVS